MKTLRFISLLFTVSIIVSCNPEIPVTWSEPGAQWRGFVTGHPSQIGQTVVNCCEPGSNCATRSIREVQPFPGTLRGYITNDNISGYFLNQDWARELPEFVPYPATVDLIKTTNPKTKIASDGNAGEVIVIYKNRTQSELGSDNVLFALRLAPGLPCPGQ